MQRKGFEDEVEVALLASYGIEEAWATLDLLARPWEACRGVDASVELLRFWPSSVKPAAA